MPELTRRGFIKSSLSAAGGLLISFHVPWVARASTPPAEINAWLSIDPDGTITIRVAKAEMGQGVLSSLPMIVAEELEADWRTVRAEYADANRQVREDRVYGRMLTAGSSSVRQSMPYLRQAGAEARERLIKAAAERWAVSPAECYADYGSVRHRPTNRALTFGEVAADAAQLSVANVRTKDPRDFDLLGLPTPRLDVPSKVDGSALFSIDVRVPNMVYAAVVHCPVLGGKLRGFRFNAVRNRKGVRQAVRLETGVAIVADTWWQAKTAAEAMPVDWDIPRELEDFYSDTAQRAFIGALDQPGSVVVTEGDAERMMDEAEESIESDYSVPYLSHACMEPLNCTAHVQDDRVDVWVGVQDAESALRAAADVAGIAPEKVHLHNCLLGGGFGRRSHDDFIREAVEIAKAVRLPVQMIWSREEDSRAGRYRPMSAIRFKAGFDLSGSVIAYTNHSVTHSILAQLDPKQVADGVDRTSVEGLADMPYRVPNKLVTHTIRNTHLTTWFWRSVGHSQNAFAMECFVDEMATATNTDPIAFRKRYLADRPDMVRVLDELAEVANWGKSMPGGTAQGVAIHECYGTICAEVAEVTVTGNGQAQVDRIVTVVDCGNLVNPMTAKEQIEGGVVFGLNAALFGKLTFENGELLETNFDRYRMIKQRDMPVLETHFALSRGDHWGGIGEPSTPPVAAAVCNAIYRITRRRIRSLPIADYYLQRA